MDTKINSHGELQECVPKGNPGGGQYGHKISNGGEAQAIFNEAKRLGVEIPKNTDNLDVLKARVEIAKRRLYSLRNGEKIAKEFQKRTPGQLIKTVQSLERRIVEHQAKIQNPHLAWGDEWDTMPIKRKDREIEHWQDEIETFTIQIKVAKMLLGE